jgi:hypothetical protein
MARDVKETRRQLLQAAGDQACGGSHSPASAADLRCAPRMCVHGRADEFKPDYMS